MSLLKLAIVGFSGGYEFELEGDGRSFVESVSFSSSQLDSLEQQWMQLKPELNFRLWSRPSRDIVSRWRKLAIEMGDCFPEELVEALTARKYQNLNLIIDDPLGLPWGRAVVGNDCLVDGWCVARAAHKVVKSEHRGRPKALVIANPDGTLRGGENLAKRLAPILESRFETTHLIGSDATVDRVRREFELPYAVVFLSCFIESGALTHRALMSDGFLCLNSLKEAQTAPGLVLCNVVSPTAYDTDFLADSLIKAGVQALILPKWASPGAAKVMESAVTAMAEGSPAGKALRQGRADWYRDHPNEPYRSDHALELWGDPEYRLPMARERSATVQSALTTAYVLEAHGPGFDFEFPIFEQVLISGKRLYLGRPGPQLNQLELPDPKLPNRVGYIEHSQGGLNLVALEDGMRVNGLPVRKSTFFQAGDVLEMADSRIEFKRPEGSAPVRRDGSAMLKIVEGSESEIGKSYQMSDNLCLVGRGDQCQLQLSDPTVSRVQFLVIERQGLYYISPVSSSSPTIVNGVAVQQETELMPGSQIRLSEETLLKFEQQGGLS